jgi:hypothetical protein
MAETGLPTNEPAENTTAPSAPGGRSKDEIALELMKFIAVTTGYGRGTHTSAGFSGKPATLSAEEHAAALLELFERCRQVMKKES